MIKFYLLIAISPALFVFSALAEISLVSAIKSNNTSQVSMLINKNNVSKKDSHGLTPLMYAINSQNREICRQLIDAGADVTVKDQEGFTVLDQVKIRLRLASPSYSKGVAMLQHAGVTNISTVSSNVVRAIDTNALVNIKNMLELQLKKMASEAGQEPNKLKK